MSLRPLSQEISLGGKAAVVTGGNQGIGAAIALRLAEAGAGVLITGRNTDTLLATVERIRQAGGQAACLQADASVAAEGPRVMQAAVESFGRVDILVNNAAVVVPASVLDMTEEQWDEVVDVGLRGAYFYSQAAAKTMIAGGAGGRIITIASTDVFEVNSTMSNYSAAKSGAVMATKAMAKELAPHGILVNAIAPGSTLTEGTLARLERRGVPLVDGRPPMPAGLVPLGRIADPDDVAKTALFLASGLSAFITGTVLVVDGGRLLGPDLVYRPEQAEAAGRQSGRERAAG